MGLLYSLIQNYLLSIMILHWAQVSYLRFFKMRPTRNKSYFKFGSNVTRFRAKIIKQNASVVFVIPTPFPTRYPTHLHPCIPVCQSRARASSCMVFEERTESSPGGFLAHHEFRSMISQGLWFEKVSFPLCWWQQKHGVGKMVCPCKTRDLDFCVCYPLFWVLKWLSLNARITC